MGQNSTQTHNPASQTSPASKPSAGKEKTQAWRSSAQEETWRHHCGARLATRERHEEDKPLSGLGFPLLVSEFVVAWLGADTRARLRA